MKIAVSWDSENGGYNVTGPKGVDLGDYFSDLEKTDAERKFNLACELAKRAENFADLEEIADTYPQSTLNGSEGDEHGNLFRETIDSLNRREGFLRNPIMVRDAAGKLWKQDIILSESKAGELYSIALGTENSKKDYAQSWANIAGSKTQAAIVYNDIMAMTGQSREAIQKFIQQSAMDFLKESRPLLAGMYEEDEKLRQPAPKQVVPVIRKAS